MSGLIQGPCRELRFTILSLQRKIKKIAGGKSYLVIVVHWCQMIHIQPTIYQKQSIKLVGGFTYYKLLLLS